MDRAARKPAEDRMPRWVKVFGLALLVVLVSLLVLQLMTGGQHGPARHASPAAVPAAPLAGGGPTGGSSR